MNLITDNKLTQSLDWFTERYQYKEGARLLMRCLLGLAILKILIQTSEPWLLEKWQDKALQVSLKVKLLLFPVELVALNPYLFVIAAVALWLLGVIIKPRYWINLLSCLFFASWFLVS